jgi:hypothetical protein
MPEHCDVWPTRVHKAGHVPCSLDFISLICAGKFPVTALREFSLKHLKCCPILNLKASLTGQK